MMGGGGGMFTDEGDAMGRGNRISSAVGSLTRWPGVTPLYPPGAHRYHRHMGRFAGAGNRFSCPVTSPEAGPVLVPSVDCSAEHGVCPLPFVAPTNALG